MSQKEITISAADQLIQAEIDRVNAERERAKLLATQMGITTFMEGVEKKLAANIDDTVTIITSEGWYSGYIDPSQNDECGLHRAQICVGVYYEQLKLKADTGETLGGVMVVVGRDRGEPPDSWSAAYSIYEGPFLATNTIQIQRNYPFNPDAPDFMPPQLLLE
jgi:hypothetical protein